MRLLDTEHGTVCPNCDYTNVYRRAHNDKLYCPNCDPKPRKIGTIEFTGMKANQAKRAEMIAAIRTDLTDHGFIDLTIVCYPKTYTTTDILDTEVEWLLVQGRHTEPNVNLKLVELPTSERLYAYRYIDHEIVRYGDIVAYNQVGFTNLSYNNRKFNQTYRIIKAWMDGRNIPLADAHVYRTALNEYLVRERTRNSFEFKKREKLRSIQMQIRHLMALVNATQAFIASYDENYGESIPATGIATFRIPTLRVPPME